MRQQCRPHSTPSVILITWTLHIQIAWRSRRAAHQVERPAAPTLALPHRDYHLWHGPLAAAAAFASLDQSPTLWWPDDRSWFVCTELDTVATDLGASEEIVAALLGVPGLRASRVSPDDPVQMPADW
ncbi:hypothetical protein [Oerskovia paurometabola]|uniref:Uncharacterized protein n=1 Tax=Oerskovia paurometabola TaxID=162170 RepID=A0ABW1X4Z4_9CELL|nr:hypothetical protein [Oerskovia paurometabola]MBM7498214.1 hypothetical protein [Oerskovia paurometabola]